jgi:hypothetical protein
MLAAVGMERRLPGRDGGGFGEAAASGRMLAIALHPVGMEAALGEVRSHPPPVEDEADRLIVAL